MRTHLLADRAGRNVSMFCGLRGSDERNGEFTTMDGREARLSYVTAANEHETTCRRCLLLLDKAKRKGP